MTISKLNTAIRRSLLDLAVRRSDTSSPVSSQLAAALEWFRNSIRPEGGSSAKYNLLTRSYAHAYPETTGYWINTLFDVRAFDPALMESIFSNRNVEKELADWLVTLQLEEGGFPGSYGSLDNQPPVVFNTGQIVLGLLCAYEKTSDGTYLDAVDRAAAWLVRVQDGDGAWRQFSRWQLSSNTRTAWGLLLAGMRLDRAAFTNAAFRNIDFALSKLNERGFFEDNGFHPERPAFTHTIAYAIRGVLECGLACGREDWIDASRISFEAVLPLVRRDGWMAGELNPDWTGDTTYVCLTGNCQLALIGYRLYEINGQPRYRESADRLLNFVRRRQLASGSPGLNGGIPGSWPLRGRYNAYAVPNWGVKFFVDALLAQARAGS